MQKYLHLKIRKLRHKEIKWFKITLVLNHIILTTVALLPPYEKRPPNSIVLSTIYLEEGLITVSFSQKNVMKDMRFEKTVPYRTKKGGD